MEGVERAHFAYNNWNITRIFFSLFSCCMSQKQKSKLFKGKWLNVERAVEPELLIWENFGVTKGSRFLRVIFYIVFVLFMLLVCFYIIQLLENASNAASNEVPDIQCPEFVDAAAANLDFYAPFEKRTGDFHCFCKNLFAAEGFDGINTFEFPLDSGLHCVEWFTHYIVVIASVIGIALLIIIGNVLVEVLISFGSKLTRPFNQIKIITNAVRAISWIQFINLGLVLFVINAGASGDAMKKIRHLMPSGMLHGDYEDINSMWYIDVGTQIIFAMLLEIIAPHIIPGFQLMIFSCRRWYDRKWTCDKNKSRRLLQ